ncbi:MAG: helicase HerA domain-containing protein [Candidatus Binataceae bacterium]
MAGATSIGSRIVATELLIQNLLAEATLVGGIYTMGYDSCLVLTNDLWKQRAGGIPRHSFLLATAMVPSEAPHTEDEEIVLLRVIGPAGLPAEAELVQVREQAMRELVTQSGGAQASTTPAILDVLTRNEIQFSGIQAKVLGTFYDEDVNGRPLLAFGSDVETFYSASRYKVYKPHGRSLSIIASYPEVTRQERAGATAPRRVRIGTIRYSSTNRRQRAADATAVPVSVNVQDFVALKTAVFGMTRLGKSNAMKTIATAVFQLAAETNQRIGQLLFDPAGEYANVTVQDQTALSAIGPEFVTIFRYGLTEAEPGFRPLSVNFYADDTIDVTWRIIALQLSQTAGSSHYIQSFLSADVQGPANEADNRSAYVRARQRRAALYAAFVKAQIPPPNDFTVSFAVNANILSTLNRHVGQGRNEFQSGNRGMLRLSASELRRFWDALLAAREAEENLGDWIDEQLNAILSFYQGTVGSGYRLLQPLRVYHSATASGDYAQQVLDELILGKIVIVDLSLGTETILQFCSERIINHVVQDAARQFAEGQTPHQIQIFIEEAHRLFNRDRMRLKEEVDPYVRLAKEAAKFRIGLIYATQEVSSVDPLILSNTSNWIVTHLNNHSEVKELSKYYDFEDFSDLTLRAEDVGFARVKTRSGRFIMPVQIDLFDAPRVQAAREVALDSDLFRSRR